MERRVLLAISLSFVVLFLYQQFLAPPPPVRPAANVTAGPAAPLTPPSPTGPPPLLEASGNLSSVAPIAAPVPSALVVGDTAEREVVVETQKVRAVFLNRGARLRHWYLKEFRDGNGELVDLVPAIVLPETPLPFSLRLEDRAVTALLNDSFYKLSGQNGAQIDASTQSTALTFELETADGLHAVKSFTLDPANYTIQFGVKVEQNGQVLNPTIDWGPGLGDEIARRQPGSFLSPSYVYQAQAIYQIVGESDAEREASTALGSGAVREGNYRWAGVDDHYFVSAVLQPGPARLEFMPVNIPTMSTPPEVGHYVAYAIRVTKPAETLKFYFGPKQLETLRAIDPEFTRAIYFGIFAFLAAPLLDALKWVYGFVGNWGWSIIVLTILINMAMAPLRHKSVVSMRRMQELQPQIKALQDRYAKYKITDPERQKMNTEMMELYRSKGVNPASGCVPMLLTLPFLFAFYAMLGQAIEIRGADWWWIRDLAGQDPLFITPVLMGLSMFWQQKITPTTADPTQQKIMMFMPIMITVTMLFAPAGLVLYWLVSNIWSIGQQYFTNSLLGPPRAPGSGTRDAKVKDVKAPPPDIVVPPARRKK